MVMCYPYLMQLSTIFQLYCGIYYFIIYIYLEKTTDLLHIGDKVYYVRFYRVQLAIGGSQILMMTATYCFVICRFDYHKIIAI